MRYGLGVLFIAFLVIVGAVILVSSGGDNSSNPKSVARSTKLVDYENKDSTTVSWTVQGKLVGQDQRRAVRVLVTRDKRTVQLLSEYEERVERSAEYTNSPVAFAAFIRALDNANFGKERNVKQADERGVCPLGNRFIYRVTDGGKEIMRTWSDTCAVADGPFGGGNAAPQLIQQLFKAQITDYIKFTNGVIL